MTTWACELIGECGSLVNLSSLFVTAEYVLQVDQFDLFRKKKTNLHSSKKDDFII